MASMPPASDISAHGSMNAIDNLPSPVYHDYTQQISVTHEHDSGDKRFSYSGTTGFRSRMDVSGR